MGRPSTGEQLLGWSPALMVWSRGLSIFVVEGRPIRCSWLQSLLQESALQVATQQIQVLPLQRRRRDRLARAQVLLSWLQPPFSPQRVGIGFDAGPQVGIPYFNSGSHPCHYHAFLNASGISQFLRHSETPLCVK